MQIYANARTEELDLAIGGGLVELSGARILWRSPLVQEGFAEYRDQAFLAAVGHTELASGLREFWPARGPRWDGLARVSTDDVENGVILVEAKSYPGELAGGGAKAAGPAREQSQAALGATRRYVGADGEIEPWLGRFYQFANRLAHMVWLREQGVDAWLVHLLFSGDPIAPTDERTWMAAIEEMHRELGFADEHLEHVGTAVLPALPRSVLDGEPAG